MAVYNGEKYIAEQLQSIYDQTRKPDEVIIRDDCSTDGTYNEIASFINENQLSDSWKLFKNVNNRPSNEGVTNKNTKKHIILPKNLVISKKMRNFAPERV